MGELKANPFGLFDVHGNVWEWVEDAWDPQYYGQFQETPAVDPAGAPSGGGSRVIRGGYWLFPASFCRSSSRQAMPPGTHFDPIGVRLALSVEAVRQLSK